MQPAKRVLFILKNQTQRLYNIDNNTYVNSPGLSLSAKFTSDMLASKGNVTKIVSVVDNNDIDREVTAFNPTHVIIEALWVVPDKFDVLHKLHPTVKWVVLIHSRIPFLMHEGIAFQWLMDYLLTPKVFLAFNSSDTADSFRTLYGESGVAGNRIVYLPNYYPINFSDNWVNDPNNLNIGCFGALRPLKNQLIQATAAIEFAKQQKKNLVFHINATRLENQADSILKNIIALFDSLPSTNFKLVQHPWLEYADFLALIKTMQLSMQVSFSETFNIVTADAVSCGIPVVVSDNIDWVSSLFKANPTSVSDMVSTMNTALFYRKYLQKIYDPNKSGLKSESNDAVTQWTNFLAAN